MRERAIALTRERWGFERRQAYRLIDAATAVSNVSNWTQALPTTESQARPLTRLEPESGGPCNLPATGVIGTPTCR